MIKLLIFWDLYWRIWRKSLNKNLEKLKKQYSPDFLIINWENMTSWKGPIEKHLIEVKDMWFDCVTWWNHTLTHEKNISDMLDAEDSIFLRPANYYETKDYKLAWRWEKIIEKNWKKILVINVMSSVFMVDQMYNPFLKTLEIIEKYEEKDLDWIIVDFHRETSAETQWMAFLLDWKASFVFWTHTHTQTNDEKILENWTGTITDIWMVWPKLWVIWADFETVKKRFLTWVMRWRIEQKLSWWGVLNGVYVEIDEKKCVKIEKIRIED